MQSSYLIFIFLSIFLFGCKKESNSVYSILTQAGNNTVSFVANGQQHTFRGKPSALNSYGVAGTVYFRTDGTIDIVVTADADHEALRLVVHGNTPQPLLGKSYQLSTSSPWTNSYYYSWMEGYNHRYLPDSSSTITFSRFDSSVIAGTFRFRGSNDSNASIQIPDGWFDIAR